MPLIRSSAEVALLNGFMVGFNTVLGAPGRFAGRKVAIICSGGNVSPAQLAGLWPHEPA